MLLCHLKPHQWLGSMDSNGCRLFFYQEVTFCLFVRSCNLTERAFFVVVVVEYAVISDTGRKQSGLTEHISVHGVL